MISSEEQQVVSFVTKLGNFSFNIIDNGFGVDWITVSNTVDSLLFDVDENVTGAFRDIFIVYTSLDTFETFTIYIAQKAEIVLASSDSILASSDLITADNG